MLFSYTIMIRHAVPGEDLVVSILEVSLLLFPHWIHQLVLVEIDNLVEGCKVRSQSNQLTQVKDTTAEQYSVRRGIIQYKYPNTTHTTKRLIIHIHRTNVSSYIMY